MKGDNMVANMDSAVIWQNKAMNKITDGGLWASDSAIIQVFNSKKQYHIIACLDRNGLNDIMLVFACSGWGQI